MSDENGDTEFEAEAEQPPPTTYDDMAEREQAAFEGGRAPNTAKIPLWKNGFINFNPGSHVSVFALISLVLLLVAFVLIALIGIFIPDGSWLERATSALGYGITAVIGAIVGSAASRR